MTKWFDGLADVRRAYAYLTNFISDLKAFARKEFKAIKGKKNPDVSKKYRILERKIRCSRWLFTS